RRTAIRLNTTLDSYLTEVLFAEGLDSLLTLETQTSEGEASLKLVTDSSSTVLRFEADPKNELPFAGSFGLYYRELFCHIPALIANQLNANGDYENAKKWYEKIFNPGAPTKANDATAKDRVWRYAEFRGIDVPKLKEILTDDAAIEVYKTDPF